jgi:hypothetical protein
MAYYILYIALSYIFDWCDGIMVVSHHIKSCGRRDIVVAIFENTCYHCLVVDHKYSVPSQLNNP